MKEKPDPCPRCGGELWWMFGLEGNYDICLEDGCDYISTDIMNGKCFPFGMPNEAKTD